MRWLCVVVFGLGVAFLFAEKLDKKEWGSLKRKMARALRAGDWEQVRDLAAKMGEDDSARAVEYLLSVADKVQDEETFTALAAVLGGMKSQEATEALVTVALKGKEQQRRVLAIKALEKRGDEKLILRLVEILQRKKEDMFVVRTLIEALGNVGGLGCAEALINYIAKVEKERKGALLIGTDWADAVKALKKISGGKEWYRAEAWRKWLNAMKETGKKVSSGGSMTAADLDLPKAPRFIGESKVISRHIVFVLDTSGSMLEKEKLTGREADEFRRGAKAVVRKWRTEAAKDDDKEKPQVKQNPKPVGKTIIVTRLERAKFHLTKMILSMDKGCTFNIVAYDITVRSWKKKLVAATEGNKRAAVKWVKGLTAQGMTHTDEAMELAWTFVKQGCDTIYLISDGWPTHTGDPRKDGELLEEKILKFFRKVNFLKKVKVHTIGFKGAHKSFMRKLAKENGGKFTFVE